jgi:hypothetical protein
MLIDMYTKMTTMRRMEQAAVRLALLPLNFSRRPSCPLLALLAYLFSSCTCVLGLIGQSLQG